MNYDNMVPDIQIRVGHSTEYLYGPDSSVAKRVPEMMKLCSLTMLGLTIIALALIRRKSEVFFSKRWFR